MTPKEHAIASLIELCKRQGGHVSVASEAGLDEQTVWQIIKGVKLPSGAPRGVGPEYQRRLTKRYPDWMTLGLPDTPLSSAAWPLPRIPKKVWSRLTERERGIIEQAAVDALKKLRAEQLEESAADAGSSGKQPAARR